MAARDSHGILLARVRGVPVYLAPSWFVVALLVVVLFGPSVQGANPGLPTGAAYAVAALYAVLLLASVLVHEAAHAVAARAVGMPVSRVVADLWGGHTAFDQDAPTPGRSAVVSVVGPVANLLLAGGGWVLLGGVGPGVTGSLVQALVVTNALVGVFNLLPGLPLDGGRLVESLVWTVTGDRHRGTVVAGWCGRAVAVLVLGFALVRPVLRGGTPDLTLVVWSAVIAALLWQGASQAIAFGGVRRRAGALTPATLLRPTVALPATDTVADALSELARTGAPWPVVVLAPDGRPAGLAGPHAVGSVPEDRRAHVALSAVTSALPQDATVRAGADGEALLRVVAQTPQPLYVVVDDLGRVVGTLDGGQVAAALTGRPTGGGGARGRS